MAESAPTTPTVSTLATRPNSLSLGGTTLIGVMGPTDRQEALIRFPSGKIVKVRKGAKVSGLGLIAAIQNDRIIVAKNGRTRSIGVLDG